MSAAIIAKLRELRIYAWIQNGRIGGGAARPSLISADGSFRLTGMAAGTVNIQFAGLDYSQATGFNLSRIEKGSCQEWSLP
ncbi:MAG: hypothetical protein ABJB61_11150 [bacterium]